MQSTEKPIVRFKKVISNNLFSISEELEMMSILIKKYEPITVSDYARLKNIKQPTALKRVNRDKVPFIILAGNKLVLKKLL